MAVSKIIGGMGVTLWADTRPFEKGLKQARADLRQFTSGAVHESNMRMRQFSANMAKGKAELVALGRAAKMGAAAGLLLAGKAALNAGRHFDALNTSMQRSLSIFGNVSKDMRAAMTDTAIGVSRNTLFTSSQSADAFRFIGSAGYSPEQAQSLLPVLAEFAQAGQFDLSVATNFAADAQAALGLKVADTAGAIANMTRVTDVLTKANILSNAEVEDFSRALTSGAAPALRLVNKDVEEGVAVLAAFAEQGIKGEAAGTAFGIVMRDLQTKAIKNASSFKQLGVDVFDASGNMNNIADIIGDVETALAGMSDAQEKQTLLQLGFADKSVAYTQALLGMSGKIRDYEDELRDAGGTTKEVSDSIMTDAEKAIRRKAAAWDKLSQSIGGATSAVKTWANNAAAFLMESATHNPFPDGMSWWEAQKWVFEAPLLPGSAEWKARREKTARQASREAGAAQFHATTDRLLNDPLSFFRPQPRTGAVSSGIGGVMGWLQSQGRFIGNIAGRTQAAGMSAAADREKQRRETIETVDKMLQGLGLPSFRQTPGQRLASGASNLWRGIKNDPNVQAIQRLAGGLFGGLQLAGSALMGQPNLAGAGGGNAFRSLAAQDPLSREGNAQRVRSLAQNQMHKLGKQQLDEQKKTRVAVEKIAANQPQRAPANLAGG